MLLRERENFLQLDTCNLFAYPHPPLPLRAYYKSVIFSSISLPMSTKTSSFCYFLSFFNPTMHVVSIKHISLNNPLSRELIRYGRISNVFFTQGQYSQIKCQFYIFYILHYFTITRMFHPWLDATPLTIKSRYI